MKPSDVRAMIGSYLVPNVPGIESGVTVRYRVVSLASGNVRLVTDSGKAETVSIQQLSRWIDDGYLLTR